MNEIKITPVNFAMQAGIYLGLLGIIKLLLLTNSYVYAFVGLLYLLVALFFHYVVFIYARKFKNEVLEGDISFFQAWNVSILMYFFGSILTGAVEFIFYRFINPGFLSKYISSTISAVHNFSVQIKDATVQTFLSEIVSNLAKGGIPTPIEMVFGHIQNTVFSGLFISLIIASILFRKNKANSINPSNDDTL